MATKKEWSAETLAEFAVEGTSAVWRAQISTAPDGKRFAGLRKYTVKADGSERADRAGFSLLLEEDNLDATSTLLGELSTLMSSLSSGLVSSNKKLKKTSPSVKTGKASTPLNLKEFALARDNAYLKSWKKNPDTGIGEVSVTKTPAQSRKWPSKAEAIAWQKARSKSCAGFKPVLLD